MASWNVGDLNYFVTQLVTRYLNERQLSYKAINEVVGVLECAKQELYRRVAAPYETQKLIQNGDVFESCLTEEQSDEA